jgi:hypothetical protein
MNGVHRPHLNDHGGHVCHCPFLARAWRHQMHGSPARHPVASTTRSSAQTLRGSRGGFGVKTSGGCSRSSLIAFYPARSTKRRTGWPEAASMPVSSFGSRGAP